MRLINADEVMTKLNWSCNMNCLYTKKQRDVVCDSCLLGDAKNYIDSMPTIEAEPTYEQVIEYCRKRSLIIITSELFNEMKARWSETVKHGRWVKPNPKGIVTYDEHAYAECSVCHRAEYLGYGMRYCPNCGAKMDENWEEPEINPCRGCTDYDGQGGCKSNGGCGAERRENETY